MKLLYWLFAPSPKLVLASMLVLMVMSVLEDKPMVFMLSGIVSIFCVKSIVEG